MTKQHFIALAKEISGIEDYVARRTAALVIIRVCKQFNPRFDTERFLTACGL